MDMTAIDTVPAHTLEQGDTVRFIDEDGDDFGLQTIKTIEDDGAGLTITSEDDTEMQTDYDTPFYIYGYTNEED
jgi:hypothetical protein